MVRIAWRARCLAILFNRVAIAVVASLIVLPYRAWGGHRPEMSDRLSGNPVPGMTLVTLDGKPFSFEKLAGQPVLVEVFASWCPPCQAVMQELRALHPRYSPRGLRFVGVLADPLVTPDSVPDALKMLRENPLPYPVVSITPEFQRAFAYEGFPAVYFITQAGRFSTTIFGYNPAGAYEEAAERMLAKTRREIQPRAVVVPGAAGSPTAPSPGPSRPSHPLRPLLPTRWEQWHPMVIHFPIALLFLEAALLAALYVRPQEQVRLFSSWVLWCAVLSFIPAIYTGVSDVGTSLGAGWAFWAGLKDRVSNFTRLESAISLHVCYALASAFVAGFRLLWRTRAEDKVFVGRSRAAYAAVTAFGLWLLFAAGQVGGGISHK